MEIIRLDYFQACYLTAKRAYIQQPLLASLNVAL